MTDDVLVLGPVAWNTMLLLDGLPERRTHMEVAREAFDTVGGTSAGKALHLRDRCRSVRLLTPLADDENGARIRAALPLDELLTLEAMPTERTERHVNLMSPQGERVSIYAAPPATTPVPDVARLRGAPAVVLDLAPWTRDLALTLGRRDLPVWTDLHDVPEEAPWHEPFWRAATHVQCSGENLADPVAFLHRLVDQGVELAVCTLGSRGAVAVDAGRREHHVEAVPCEVVDSNGAGDAFFAGVMTATLDGADVPAALRAGAEQAVRSLTTRELGPGIRR